MDVFLGVVILLVIAYVVVNIIKLAAKDEESSEKIYKMFKEEKEILEEIKQALSDMRPKSVDENSANSDSIEIRREELHKKCLMEVLKGKTTIDNYLIDAVVSDNKHDRAGFNRYAGIGLRDLSRKIESEVIEWNNLNNEEAKQSYGKELGFSPEELKEIIQGNAAMLQSHKKTYQEIIEEGISSLITGKYQTVEEFINSIPEEQFRVTWKGTKYVEGRKTIMDLEQRLKTLLEHFKNKNFYYVTNHLGFTQKECLQFHKQLFETKK